MKRLYIAVIVVLAIIAIGCGKTAEKQETAAKQTKHYSIEQFMDNIALRGCEFTHDGKKILYASNQTGIFNVYAVPVEGGEAEPLTQSAKESYYLVSAFPNDNRLLFRADSGGNEVYHIFLRQEDGTVEDLTPDASARATFLDWSHDSGSFFYTYNKRDPRFPDIYEMDITTTPFTPKLLYKNEKGLGGFQVSGDKRYIAMEKVYSDHNSDIYLFDRETSTLKNITAHEGEIVNSPEPFAPGSKELYFLSNENSEFMYLKRFDLASGKIETVVQKEWPIRSVYFSPNGRYRVITINHDARIEIEIFDTQQQKPVTLPEFPGDNITTVRIARDGKAMAFFLESSTAPYDLHVYQMETGKYRKLTACMNPGIDREDLAEARVIRYKSFDGLEIPAIYYAPPHIKEGEKIPALVLVHGGPGGQSRVRFDDLVQYLVNHGYAVLAVNNRGSSGYGKTFFRLDDLKHGEDDLADCVAAKKFLADTGYIDENKIGIIGGSYGGYMVLAALAFQPGEFAVGVNVFGVTNWVRTLKSIPKWWESFRDALYAEMGNPETDLEYLKRISPLFHADKITKPLIVLQGANDPRVLQVESDEIVAAVKKKGIPVEYIVFPDEGHGFRKKHNEIKANKAILEFLDKYLKGKKETYVY
jgi:dipeptidyl aminopeptidase/acylaminoacyl peptidase